MHLSHWAAKTPDAIAIRMAWSGETLTYAALEAASNRGAHLLRRLGLKRGDAFALWSTNNPQFLEITSSMQRSGLYMAPIPSKLKAQEAAYLINDSRARVLIIDAGIGAEAAAMARDYKTLCPGVEHAFSLREPLPGLSQWEDATAEQPATPISDQSLGAPLIYSSGTTGKPKGVVRPLSEEPFDAEDGYETLHKAIFKTVPGAVFLITAPLYHSGTMAFATTDLKLGGTIVVFEKFDAEKALELIATYRIQSGQFVPTMFSRMLKLPPEVRARYDTSSLKAAMHSAAPCPREIKQAMIEWWGPILYEIYGGTENAGSTLIDSHEWLKKPGTVGRSALGPVHVCAEDGSELAVGETGVLYFEGGSNFSYLNDADKTRNSRHPTNPAWATFGDIGRVDEDGYIFLSDRRAFMIIAGGVNIYPQEAENLLTLHPDVTDVAVFGVPDPDMGEQVKAVVQPADWSKAGPELEAQLIAHCKAHLASLKCPKSIDFLQELPRDPTGKMMKRELRERYWAH
jgi:acyl-CoA synthetase (AMP-forming)/AMP-acid ligase II